MGVPHSVMTTALEQVHKVSQWRVRMRLPHDDLRTTVETSSLLEWLIGVGIEVGRIMGTPCQHQPVRPDEPLVRTQGT